MPYDLIFNLDLNLLTVTKTLLLIIGLSFGWYNFSRNIVKWYENRKKLPPGPIGLPFVGYLPFLGIQPQKTLWKLKDKYGDIMGLYLGNKYTIVLSDYNIVKEVLSHPSSLNRSPNMFASFPYKGFQARNGEAWLEQRRFVLSTIRDLGIHKEGWQDMILDEVTHFIEEILAAGGKPIDLSKSLALTVSSNMMSLLIGRKLEKNSEEDKINICLDFAKKAFLYIGPSEPAGHIVGLRKVLEYFRILGYDKIAETNEKFGQFLKKEIDNHKTFLELKGLQDFINMYLRKLEELSAQKNNTHHYSESMLQGNLTILFIGATDTIFSSLTWLMRLMADHQDIQKKVYSELVEVVGKNGRLSYSEKHKTPYTIAVLLEAQRFSSIVPLGTTRVLSEDYKINGYTLPKGAEVVPNVWGIHYDTKYWKDPEKFCPEHFLTNDSTGLLKNVPGYAPFSIGRRNCPGETIAWMEILGYFTQIIMKFEIHLPEGEKAEYEVIHGLVSQLQPQALCFKERN